jgi:hypothetical protein
LTVGLAFTPTSGTATSATGVLQAIRTGETAHGSLAVHTTGLAAGTYKLDAIKESGTAPVTIRKFDVKDASKEGAPAQAPGPLATQLPSKLDPFDIASLAISDSKGAVLLTADLAAVTEGSFHARTPIVSGTGIDAKGVAKIQAFAKDGVVTGTLSVTASGLPASTVCTYSVDGTKIGAVRTGSAGSLKLIATEKPHGGTLPDSVDLFTVTKVTVEDASGTVLLSAHF